MMLAAARRRLRFAAATLAGPSLVAAAGLYLSDAASRRSFDPAANALPPLRDAVHDTFPAVAALLDFSDPASPFACLPDRLLFALTILTAAMLASYGFRPAVRVLREACLLQGVLQALRATLVGSTTYPSPVPACRNAVAPPNTGCAISIFCQDCLYSGHTVNNCLCLFFWWAAPASSSSSSSSSSSLPWVLCKVGVAVMTAVNVSVSVLSKDHYTVDVLVAVYLTTACCLVRRHAIADAFVLDNADDDDGPRRKVL